MSEDLTKQLPQSADEKLTLVLATVQAMAVRVDNLEQTVKLRVYDTRPILQKLVMDVRQLQEGQRRLEEGHRRLEENYQRLEEGQECLRSELQEFRREVKHSFLILSGTPNARYRDLDRRVTWLELNMNLSNSQT
jgi:predicted RNase H-like nuclease (RuvC/YqgF family)